jgi:hypothetical protein
MQIIVDNNPPSKNHHDGSRWVRLQTEQATGVWLQPKDKLVTISDAEYQSIVRARDIIQRLIKDVYTYEGDLEASAHFSVDDFEAAQEWLKNSVDFSEKKD